jgi:hypothetical protein
VNAFCVYVMVVMSKNVLDLHVFSFYRHIVLVANSQIGYEKGDSPDPIISVGLVQELLPCVGLLSRDKSNQ